MSLVVERFLICDSADCKSSTVDGNRHYPNAFILRLEARNNGWYIGPKKDLCPECAYLCKQFEEDEKKEI